MVKKVKAAESNQVEFNWLNQQTAKGAKGKGLRQHRSSKWQYGQKTILN